MYNRHPVLTLIYLNIIELGFPDLAAKASLASPPSQFRLTH